jgi:chromate reductase, NAD(P)H dehydrogenase (quinone)
MAKLKLGVIVGSIRRDSINRKLANALIKLGADHFDATILLIDDLPLFNQDNENPPPDAPARFKRAVTASQALLFVTPEHSRSIPAALKNAIDWGGRPYGTSVWPGKPAAVIGASPGAISTAVAQTHLRSVLGSFSGMHVMGGEAYIQFKPDLIAADFSVPDETVRKFLQTYLENFAKFASRFAS